MRERGISSRWKGIEIDLLTTARGAPSVE